MECYNKMTNEIMDVEKFIEGHKHVYYCEAIIFPDGKISYAVPSHEQRLLEVVGISITEAKHIIPITEITLIWLMEKTGCIPIWYNGFKVIDKFTIEQAKTIRTLLEYSIITPNIIFDRYMSERESIDIRRKVMSVFNSINHKGDK